MKSVFKKIKSVVLNGTEPIDQGINNYKLRDPDIEELARKRMEICKGCPNYVDEPIDLFKVKDERIQELSDKMCDECGCSLTYLLRQNIKICKHWKE